MTKEEIEKQIEAKKQELAKLEEELKQAEELKPFDWNGKDRLFVNELGCVCQLRAYIQAADLFYFPYTKQGKKQAEKFAHRLKIQSTILRLKQSLGDEYEFNHSSSNWYLCYGNQWGMKYTFTDNGQIMLNDYNQDLIDYMNKHFPNGWE